ncbi:hypothetical protein GY45DRAFT_1255614 [Cubamyces sp. BRFM 1775]|nr:hypothetical protein GY45DRAFT_1255614 [Cubamyces sp. BRFM 1775]
MSRRASSGSIALLSTAETNRPNAITAPGSSRRSSHTAETSQARRPPARTASSSHKLDSLVNLNDLNPDELFTKHTVAEIRMVQNRLRAEADAKQEELRLMVGERYRDLLEASTSILSLAKSSKHVLEALEEMRDTVQSIDPSPAPKRAATGEDKHLQVLQSLSAHVKLLLDAPEHLWRLMERKVYLNAAWLFLLARVVHRALSQDDDEQSWHTYGIDVAEQLPLVQRQWDSITPFRSQISHRATLFLREVNAAPGEVCATLLTLHLLESRPLPETLSIYLAQRTKTLSTVLARNASAPANGNVSDSKPNGKAPHRPRKVVVREAKQRTLAALDVVSRTVHTARLVFADPSGEQPSMMKQALQFFQAPSETATHLPSELQLSTQILLSTLPSSSQLLLLPQSIRAYKPYVDGASLTAPSLQAQLQVRVEGWLAKAVQELRDAMSDWVAPLESVREVWDVRASLLEWLKNAEGLQPSEQQELGSLIDSVVLAQAATVWKTALHRLESSFEEVVSKAADALTENPDKQTLDTQPAEYLLQAPPIPSGLQTGAHSAATAAVQFSKYRSTLQQQLQGRTPLVNSALSTLERHAADIREDIAVMQKSSSSNSDLVDRLSRSYRADAEDVCQNLCRVLERVGNQQDSMLRVPLYVARITRELASSSSFFQQLECGETAVEGFRQRLNTLATKQMQKWQEETVSRVIQKHLGDRQLLRILPKAATGNANVPARPSSELTEALLSLSSEIQSIGASLDDEARQTQVYPTLRRFVSAFLDALADCPASEQLLWNLSFLRQLAASWGPNARDVLEQIDATVTKLRNGADTEMPSQTNLEASAQEYLAKTQVLLAALLPSHPVQSTAKADKSSSLLLFGSPAAEQGFEPALQLVKPPPRLGLLLVGGAVLK